MNVYPAIVTTPSVRLDGLYVDERGSEVRVRTKNGGNVMRLRGFEIRQLDGDRRYLVHATDATLGRGMGTEQLPITLLVEPSDRPCGCGGPRREEPSPDALATLATW